MDENLHVIHYSSDLQGNCPDQTPSVSAIVVEHILTGVQTQFAAFTIAERARISPVEFRDHLGELERELLQAFHGFAVVRPESVWVHWGMRGPSFGFDVLAQRARLHNLEPTDIPTFRRFDLANYMKLRYGDQYVPHPRLWNAIRQNLGTVPNLLDEGATASAWRSGDYAAVLWSLSAKVGAIANLLDRTRRGTFIVAGSGTVGASATTQPGESMESRGAVSRMDLAQQPAHSAGSPDALPRTALPTSDAVEAMAPGAPTAAVTGQVPLTAKQRQIMNALVGRALTLKELARRLGRCDQSRLHRDHIKPLMDRGIIVNAPSVGGYYRPDAPPTDDTEGMAE